MELFYTQLKNYILVSQLFWISLLISAITKSIAFFLRKVNL